VKGRLGGEAIDDLGHTDRKKEERIGVAAGSLALSVYVSRRMADEAAHIPATDPPSSFDHAVGIFCILSNVMAGLVFMLGNFYFVDTDVNKSATEKSGKGGKRRDDEEEGDISESNVMEGKSNPIRSNCMC